MAAQINIPKRAQPKQDETGKILQLAGTVAGGIIGGMGGGPAGAIAGASMGNQLGGMAGSFAQNEPQQVRSPQSVESSAFDRRMKALNDSNLAQLRTSIDSLKYIDDPQTRVTLAKPLIKAQMIAEREA